MSLTKELKFIHITKTAGTSIEDIGYKHGIKWGRHHSEYKDRETSTCTFWHDTFIHKTRYLKERYDWFTVVRNPFTRVISELHCKYKTEAVDLNCKQSCNDYLMRKIKYQGQNSTGGHFTPQYLYIDDTISTKIHILKFETLNTEFNALMRLYEFDEIKLDQWKNRGERDVASFTVRDFSPELIDLILTVYEKDFERFHYPRTPP
jgi:hypothetical protein